MQNAVMKAYDLRVPQHGYDDDSGDGNAQNGRHDGGGDNCTPK
jgi:hypothetical protein